MRNQSERDFVGEIALRYPGATILYPTTQQDMREHWDVRVPVWGKVDIKGMKKVNREDDNAIEDIHWIELQNVNGNIGWLYGKADTFAFETKDYWIMVSNEELISWIKQFENAPLLNEKKLYHRYQREGRKDIIVMVKTLDLCYLSETILNKKVI